MPQSDADIEEAVMELIHESMRRERLDKPPTPLCFDHDDGRMKILLKYLNHEDFPEKEEARQHLVDCPRCHYIYAIAYHKKEELKKKKSRRRPLLTMTLKDQMEKLQREMQEEFDWKKRNFIIPQNQYGLIPLDHQNNLKAAVRKGKIKQSILYPPPEDVA